MRTNPSWLAACIALAFQPCILAADDHAESDQLAAEAAAFAPEFQAAAAPPTDPTGAGAWGPVISWTPHIPVTAATLPDGRLLTFASNQRTTFPSGPEFTYAAVWDPATGQFFVKDLSRLGTTVNGEKVPSSIEFAEGQKRDRNVEAPVPKQARIGLAGVVFLEFRCNG